MATGEDRTMTGEKQRKAQERTQALAWVQATWPADFTEAPRPLAVGAHTTIHESAERVEIDLAMVKAALGMWCNRIPHIRPVADAGHRVSLDGREAESITPAQQEQAPAADPPAHGDGKAKAQGPAAAGRPRSRSPPEIRTGAQARTFRSTTGVHAACLDPEEVGMSPATVICRLRRDPDVAKAGLIGDRVHSTGRDGTLRESWTLVADALLTARSARPKGVDRGGWKMPLRSDITQVGPRPRWSIHP
jgi:sRNA-binding protein